MNGGLSDARNYGLDRMNGDYVTFVDSDDELSPNTLEPLLNIMHNHPEYDILEYSVLQNPGEHDETFIDLGNQNIKWETLRMFNIGIDLSFFNNRLNTTFEWYKKNNINALVKPVYPTIVGITGSSNLPYENMGEIENKGWEWWIQWRDRIGEFTYSAAFNICF